MARCVTLPLRTMTVGPPANTSCWTAGVRIAAKTIAVIFVLKPSVAVVIVVPQHPERHRSVRAGNVWLLTCSGHMLTTYPPTACFRCVTKTFARLYVALDDPFGRCRML